MSMLRSLRFALESGHMKDGGEGQSYGLTVVMKTPWRFSHRCSHEHVRLRDTPGKMQRHHGEMKPAKNLTPH